MDMYISVNGDEHELPDTAALTFGEWRLVKHELGLNAAEFEMALKNIDQDAWYWLCVIAVSRTDKRPREEIQADIDSINFLELFSAFTQQEETPDPPTDPGPTGGEKSSPAITPAPAGASVSQLSSV